MENHGSLGRRWRGLRFRGFFDDREFDTIGLTACRRRLVVIIFVTRENRTFFHDIRQSFTFFTGIDRRSGRRIRQSGDIIQCNILGRTRLQQKIIVAKEIQNRL